MPPDLYRWFNLVDNGKVEHLQTTSQGLRQYSGQSAQPYYGRAIQSNETRRIINYYGPNDAALTAWELNQLTKPDKEFAGDGYFYQNNHLCDATCAWRIPNSGSNRCMKKTLAVRMP